jgi:hypothetical protein
MSDDALDYARTDARQAMEAQRGMATSHGGKDEGYYTDEAATYAKEQETRAFMRSTPTYTLSPSKNAEALKRQAKLIEERVKPTRESPAGALAHWILRGRTASGADPFNMREPFEDAARRMNKVLVRHLEELNAKRKEAAVEIVKGDLPGHEFRGNQWTDGGGSGPEMHQGVADASPDSRKPPAPKADPDYDQAESSAAHAANIHGATAYLFRGPENTGPVHVRFSETHPEPGWTKIGEVKPTPAGGKPTKYERDALGSAITAQDTKDSGKRGFNPYALPQMLAAADRVEEAVKGGLDPSRAFAAEFNPTRGNHGIARKLGLHLTVERGQWVVRPEAGPAPKGYRGESHVRDQSLATGSRRGTFPGLKGYDGDYYEGDEVRQKEADMDVVVKALADELFGVEKGDVEGHPFRGNQYTDGGGGGGRVGDEEAQRAEDRGGKASWLNAEIARHNAGVRAAEDDPGAKSRAEAVSRREAIHGEGKLHPKFPKANGPVTRADDRRLRTLAHELGNRGGLDQKTRDAIKLVERGQHKVGPQPFNEIAAHLLDAWDGADKIHWPGEKKGVLKSAPWDDDQPVEIEDEEEAPAAASAPAEGSTEGAPPAKGNAKNDEKKAGAVPGGDPTEADPQLGGMLDQLAQGLLAEIQPLKQGGDPTQIATALKTALEKFAASFMQTYAGAPNPAAAAPGAPPAKPAAPPQAPPAAPPQAAPPQAAPPQAAPGQAPPAGGPPKKEKPPWMKGIDSDVVKEFASLDEDELRGIVQRATKRNIEDARRQLSGRLPD